MQARPELRDRIAATPTQSSSAAASSTAPPAPQMQPIVLPSFGGLAPQFGMMPTGPPSIAPPAAQSSTGTALPTSRASIEATHEANTFENYWASNARDDAQHRDASHGQWWSNRERWSWSDAPQRSWEWNRERAAWQSSRRDSPQHSTAQPEPEQVHGNVRRVGWTESGLIDRPVRHNRGRPFYVGARGQYLCGIACTARLCPYNYAPCNYTIRDLESDWHTGHECSFCRRDREQRRHRNRDDP